MQPKVVSEVKSVLRVVGGSEDSWVARNSAALEERLKADAFQTRRREGLERFDALGFPRPRDEEWLFTNIAPIAKTPFAEAGEISVARVRGRLPLAFLGARAPHRLVFLNGRFSAELSKLEALPKGILARSLAREVRNPLVEAHLGHVADENLPFVTLNTAFLEDGALLHIAKGALCEAPIEILYISDGEMPVATHPRTLLVAETGASVEILETHVGLEKGSPGFRNPVTEIVLAEEAQVNYIKLELDSENAHQVSTLQAHLGRASRLTTHTYTFGGALVRNNIKVVLDGEGAEATLNGLYVMTGDEHVDNHTTIVHAKPHCESHELYKGILAGKSRGVFNGKIIVAPDAQKTNAKQSNRNLLLSGEASVNTKPELQIHADDVKCTHGATIGQLDENAIFYLRSRGLDEATVKTMLVRAFALDVVERVKRKEVREFLDGLLLEKLAKTKAL